MNLGHDDIGEYRHHTGTRGSGREATIRTTTAPPQPRPIPRFRPTAAAPRLAFPDRLSLAQPSFLRYVLRFTSQDQAICTKRLKLLHTTKDTVQINFRPLPYATLCNLIFVVNSLREVFLHLQRRSSGAVRSRGILCTSYCF